MNGLAEQPCFKGSRGELLIRSNDKTACKLAMLFEGECMDVSREKAALKYGYSRQHYYVIFNSFKRDGSKGLEERKRGPKNNHVRTDEVNKLIIRHRFLDPDASAAVIAQKMRQSGYKVSQRSVERTITESGLQKKTPFVKSREKEKGS